MKRGAPEHPKTYMLMAVLNIERWGAVGILESLWHFAQKFAPAGDVGKHTDEAIARHIGWTANASTMVSALVQAGWLDRCTCHRVRIHDWHIHADKTVKAVLVNNHQHFLACYHDSSMVVPPSVPAVAVAVALPSRSQSVAVAVEKPAPTYPLPPDVRAETAIREGRWKNERSLYAAVGEIAQKTGKDPGEVMEHVTAYKRRDGSVAPGRKRPELLRSDEAVEKSLADAKAWLAKLEVS